MSASSTEGSGPRVLCTRPLPDATLARLAAACSLDCGEGSGPLARDELLRRVAPVEGLVVMPGERVDAELCDAAPELRVVSTVSVGFDHIDVAELGRRGIACGHTPGVLTDATADLTFALILAVARRIVEAHDAVVTGRWPAWAPSFMLGRELAGSTLGIVGLGRIGAAVARRARAFNMEVLATTRRLPAPEGVEVVSLDELLGRAEYVSLHVALTPETRHLIGRRELEMMRRDAVLINTARGAVVDQEALVEALGAGVIAAAGLDVVEQEPISPDDPLLAQANCLVLPHIGSATVATRRAMAELAVDNLLAGLAGTALPHAVTLSESSLSGPRGRRREQGGRSDGNLDS
jgi:lactate dehydrogenase-like 2-hydroxyacid dehydrogenase